MKTKPLCRYFLSVYIFKKSKRSAHIALHGNPPQGYGASPVRWDHTVLPATRHRWARPALTPAIQAGTRFTCRGEMEGWVDLGDWLYTEVVYLHFYIHIHMSVWDYNWQIATDSDPTCCRTDRQPLDKSRTITVAVQSSRLTESVVITRLHFS